MPVRAHTRSEGAAGLGLATPAALLLLAFVIGPTLAVLGISLTDWNFAAPHVRFLGLGNYGALLSDPLFWTALRNTCVYVLITVPGSVLLGLGVALLIPVRSWLAGVYRVAFFLPVSSTMVVMATVWEYLMHPSVGPINQMLVMIGAAPINFLGSGETALGALAAIGVWEMTGFNMVVFLAGLAAIPADLYAAAAVDGADTPWERFRVVTWPLLGPTTLFVVVITAIRAFRLFDTVALLTQGGPGHVTDVLVWRIYVEAFQYLHIGYAAALTMIFLVLVVLLAFVQLRVLGRRVHYA